VFRFRRTAATLMGIGAVVALSVLPAIPASAHASDIKIDSASSYQYYLYCNENDSPPPCNLQGSEQLVFDVWNADGGPASTVGYTIINGSAVDGVGFNIPVTGTIDVPSGGGTGALIVPVLNASGPGSTGTFTVKLATGATATGTIMPGAEVPSDCSLSATNNTAISITCTDRPVGQTWYAWAWCPAFKIVLKEGNEVTGDGTSTVVCDAYSPLYGEAWFASLS
jgi:hypothetical protein